MSTEHERGYALAERIAGELGVPVAVLREVASRYLAEQYDEHGITDADIGSSDVSVTLSMLARTEPELLRSEAALVKERDELVSSIAARTGKSQAETLANLQRLLAPVVERAECGRCGTPVEHYKGLWWSGDDFMCPDGEEQHIVGNQRD